MSYRYILSVKFDCIVLCYLSGRNLVPAFLLFCNKEPKLKLPWWNWLSAIPCVYVCVCSACVVIVLYDSARLLVCDKISHLNPEQYIIFNVTCWFYVSAIHTEYLVSIKSFYLWCDMFSCSHLVAQCGWNYIQIYCKNLQNVFFISNNFGIFLFCLTRNLLSGSLPALS